MAGSRAPSGEGYREEERLHSGEEVSVPGTDAMAPRAGRSGRCGEGARASVAAVHLRPRPPTMNPRVSRSFVRRRDAQKPLILVVDDGDEARDLYCAYLEFHGFGAEAAEDGPSGIAMALATGPDAIVLDFSMPKMDGAEVLRRLKADERTRSIPVVMVTAVPELVGREARSWCAAFLEKPCEPDRLMETIEDLVRGHALYERESGGRSSGA
jgi:two-component system cell cycle response regulator DivK